MAQYRIYDPDEMLECPYDRTHMISAKRMQYHLIDCKKNFPGKEFEKCPFNATHHIPKPEFRHHLAHCPDKAILEPEFNYAAKKETGVENRLKGYTDVPVYTQLDIQSEEDWGAEVSSPVRVGPQYNDTYFERVQFKDLSGLSKNQRGISDNRQTSKQKMEELKDKTVSGNAGQEIEEENLRLPKKTPMAAMIGKPHVPQPDSSVFAYSIRQGQGRGRGVASFNPETNGQTPIQNDTYAHTLQYGRGMNIGDMPVGGPIGRGRGAVGHGNFAPPSGFYVPKVGPGVINKNRTDFPIKNW